MDREFTDSREGFSVEEEMEYNEYLDSLEDDDEYEDDYDDSMDGDFDSAMRDAGFGTDEDYGYYGDYEDYYG